MPSLDSLFGPLRSAATAFFKHDIALRRGEGGLQIVLEQRGPVRRSAAELQAEEAAIKEQAALDLMRGQLGALLDEVAGTRGAMRHLVFVERGLARDGIEVLHKLPLDVLRRALEQFEGLVTNWSPVGLATLRSKMAVAVIEREQAAEPDTEAEGGRTAVVLDTGPLAGPPAQPMVVERSDDEALAAAYAALGSLAPTVPASAEAA